MAGLNQLAARLVKQATEPQPPDSPVQTSGQGRLEGRQGASGANVARGADSGRYQSRVGSLDS